MQKSYSISAKLRRAISLRRHGEQNQESINGIIQSLALYGLENDSHFNHKNKDIEALLKGSP